MYLLGFDIGGTKCAAVTAEYSDGNIKLLKRAAVATDLQVSPATMLERLAQLADGILERKPERIGISCGGPLDSVRGVILSPPNLAGWDEVYVVKFFEERFGAPTRLSNDANASCVAEWKFGAGRGYKNMVFLTFGTGLGAGLILDGRLYEGTNGNAGEVGHIRLAEDGPVGYGKAGSFEGFCSGGGIARLALKMAEDAEVKPLYYKKAATRDDITAKAVAEAAREGDPMALRVFQICAERLGAGLSVLIDILNPEIIVIGSVFARNEALFHPYMDEIIQNEALRDAAECVKIVPAMLGEQIGDYAAIGVSML